MKVKDLKTGDTMYFCQHADTHNKRGVCDKVKEAWSEEERSVKAERERILGILEWVVGELTKKQKMYGTPKDMWRQGKADGLSESRQKIETVIEAVRGGE